MANCPKVVVQRVGKMGITFKGGSMKVSFEVPQPGEDALKLIWFQATARPIDVTFESPQSEMDLKLTPVNIKTGEVK